MWKYEHSHYNRYEKILSETFNFDKEGLNETFLVVLKEDPFNVTVVRLIISY